MSTAAWIPLASRSNPPWSGRDEESDDCGRSGAFSNANATTALGARADAVGSGGGGGSGIAEVEG
jgi:hypothetical protein